MGKVTILALVAFVVGLLAGCAQPTATPSSQRGPSAAAAATSSAPTRITIATFRELDFLPYSAVPGTYELRNAVNPGLSVLDDRGALRAVLGEAVPTLDNGLWKLLPDGKMETTWHIRQGAAWHDGEPLTSDDLAFTIQVGRDRTTGGFGVQAYSSVEDVATPDQRTVTITWKQPYIDADQLFTIWAAWPIPKHLLADQYSQDPAALSQSSFWTTDYVGSGPYRLAEFDVGQRMSLQAADTFALGRPKIDRIDVIYTPDPSTVLANIVAGTVDMTVGLGFSVDSVAETRDRWTDGRFTFEFSDQRWFTLHPQFIDPNPAGIGDLRFRRAMMYAIDRQEMVDSLQAGLSQVATTFMAPNQPEYAGIAGHVMKYEYDPKKASQILDELGYSRGSDGMLRDRSGQRVEIEIAGSNDAVTKTMLAVGDYWQRVGVATNPFVVPPQRATDWVYRATFPGFALFTATHDLGGIPALRSGQARTAQNNYEVSGLPNWPRYQSPELDDLVAKYFSTIPKNDRLEVLTQINQHVFENLVTMPLYYFPTPYALSNRMVNVATDRAARASLTWNIQDWQVKS